MQKMASVLVADDDAMVRALLDIALRDAGYQVETARDGLDAIEMFMAGDFDLVLTDIRMPRMDGCMVAQYVWASNKKVPVIGMSSEIQGFNGKFDLLLEKPFPVKLLVEKISEAFGTAQSV